MLLFAPNDMKLPQPFSCDECKTLKQPSNGWYIGMTQQSVHLPAKNSSDNEETTRTSIDAVVLIPWNSEIANADEAIHLCGPKCAMNFVGKTLTK